MKKLWYIIICICTLTYSNVFSETSSLICNSSDWYELYECRVKNTCSPYKPQPIFFQTKEYKNYDTQTPEYKKAQEEKRKQQTSIENIWDTVADFINFGDDLNIAKNIYKNNMNNIYKCAIIWVQEKSLRATKQLLANNSYLKSKIQSKIESQIGKLTRITGSLKCNQSNDNNSVQKLQVLKQTSYETCKYNSYLEYLRERNSHIKNIIQYNEDLEKLSNKNSINNKIISTNQEEYNLSTIINLEKSKKNEIDEEIKRAYKIFPIAYHAYSEYENNFSIHILLELLREDFIAFRKNYHKTINPINQVWYKIINAMKK